ncbi:hypothetical protein D3C81_1987680 [compost metagenome]
MSGGDVAAEEFKPRNFCAIFFVDELLMPDGESIILKRRNLLIFELSTQFLGYQRR